MNNQIIDLLHQFNTFEEIQNNVEDVNMMELLINEFLEFPNSEQIVINELRKHYSLKSKTDIEKQIEELQESYTKPEIQLSDEQQKFINIALAGKNCCIVSGGGFGKSTVIKELIKQLNKKYEDNPDAIGVTAMTGVAAVLIGATTINSFLKIGLAKDSAEDLYKRISKSKRDRSKFNVLSKDLKVLIIDEISMMSAALFGKISDYFKYIRRCDQPFGGVQIILSGDLCQLPPIENKSGYIFQSEEWKEMDMCVIELTKCFRQSKDLEFQEILSNIRFGKIDNKSYLRLQELNTSKFEDSGILPTKLFPTNKEVDSFNEQCLNNLCQDTDQQLFEFKIKKVSKDSKKIQDVILLNGIPESVYLAIGAQVMITFNINIEAELVNGTRGVITDICNNSITIKKLDGSIHVITYVAAYDPEEKHKDHPTSIFEYIPLKVAFATSVHKSQGSTIEFLEVDLSNSFGYGMGYVALSRAVSLDNLIITGITKNAFRCCPLVKKFYQELNYT